MSYIYDKFKKHLLDGNVEFVDEEDVINLMSGTYHHQNPIILGSASSMELIRPVYEVPEESEPIMWKCKGCGRVHKVDDTLECDCGMPITEDSRFVLLEKK